MATREEIQKWALEDHAQMVGKTIFVRQFTAYYMDGSVDFSLEEPVKAKMLPTPEMDILHWNDDWLDPYWDLEILEIPKKMLVDHPKLANITSPYMFGDSYSLDGKYQPARFEPRLMGPRHWTPRESFDRKRKR